MEKQQGKRDGVLDSTFLVEGPEADDEEAGGQEAAPEEGGEQAAAQPEPKKTELPSRRQRARERDEAILAEVRAVREEQAKRDAEYREHLAAIRQENAELRGSVHAYANQPRQQETQQRQQGPDPEALLREAQEALDRKDFTLYQRKTMEASAAEAQRRVFSDPRFQQPQQAQPQVNPMLAAIAAQYPDVMGDPEALAVAQAHGMKLVRAGSVEGPDVWKKSFDRAREFMKPSNGRQNGPQFSQRNAAVVAGVPGGSAGGGNGGGGGTKGVILTAEERKTAAKFKMSEAAYAQHLAAMHPDRVVE